MKRPATSSGSTRWWDRRVSGTTVAMLALGLASFVMLWASHRIADGHVQEDAPLDGAVSDLRVAVATSHLWLEEYLSGDPTIDIDRQVWDELERASALARALVEGGEGIETPLEEGRMRRAAEQTQELLVEFRGIAEQRVEIEERAVAGSDLDRVYDEVFEKLLTTTRSLNEQIDERMHANQRRSGYLFVGILVFWGAVVLLFLSGLVRRERMRRRAELALAESEERLATTLASIGDGVVTLDRGGRVRFLNRVAEELSGWTSDEAAGRPLPEVVSLLDASAAEGGGGSRALESLDETSIGAPRELVVESRDGRRVPVEESSAPLRDRQGRAVGVVLALRDISERREAEAALREKEAQLRQAQKLEAVGRLAGGMAHDINNYLAAIGTQCELIKILYPEDPRLHEKMDEALDVIARTTSLIRRLLAFSRSRPNLREVVSLNCVASSMSAMLRRLLGADVELELELEEAPWNVEIDPSQVEQILVNLLVNARDAMPEGGRVRVVTENVVVREGEPLSGRGALEIEPGEHSRLSVADSGPGIPEEALDQIFEPFYTTKDTSDRSGLGLATVYGIVRQNGGALRVDSRLGEGTTFHIYLPRTRRPATAEERRPADAPQSDGEGRRILFAEDNLDVARSLTAMLTALGHEVVHEESGRAALERFEERPGRFELVISDIVMPGMNGRELAERLWAYEPGLPVLFISGYTDRVVLDDLIPGRRADLLAKPFTAADLTAKIAGVMAREVEEQEAS